MLDPDIPSGWDIFALLAKAPAERKIRVRKTVMKMVRMGLVHVQELILIAIYSGALEPMLNGPFIWRLSKKNPR